MSKDKEEVKIDTHDDHQAKSNFLNSLSFRNYMREQNKDDRELMERFLDYIPVPKGWSIEDHMGDFRPSIWLRKDDYIIQIYAVMGAISAMFGEIKKNNLSNMNSLNSLLSNKAKQDFSMLYPIFPAKEIPHENEEDDEDDEDFEKAAEALTDFNMGCLEYIKSITQKNEESQSQEDNNKSNPKRSDPVNK